MAVVEGAFSKIEASCHVLAKGGKRVFILTKIADDCDYSFCRMVV